MTYPYLSVVIPVFNEEKTIEETLRRIEAFLSLKAWDWEVIVANDGSTDRTDERVRQCAASHSSKNIRLLSSERNRGKGAACRRGVLEARGRYVLLTDADLSTPIKEADKLMEAIESGYDAAIGSRAVRSAGADVQQSFKRRLAGRVFNGFVRALVIRDFRDTQCGFKCFRHDAARELFGKQRLDGFSFDVEILYLAGKTGLKVKEVPVMWRQGKTSRVSLFRDSFAMLKELLTIRRLYKIGR